MSIWKYSNSYSGRFTKTLYNYVRPNVLQHHKLAVYIKEVFDVDLCDVNYLEVMDKYTHTSLEILMKNGTKMSCDYSKGNIPNILHFDGYYFEKIPQLNDDDIVSLTIRYSSIW